MWSGDARVRQHGLAWTTGCVEMPGDWQVTLCRGPATRAEVPEDAGGVSRPDCHTGSALRDFELSRTALWIDSAAPGWRGARGGPRGRLTRMAGFSPHPRGDGPVKFELRDLRLLADVSLPAREAGESARKGKGEAGSSRAEPPNRHSDLFWVD